MSKQKLAIGIVAASLAVSAQAAVSITGGLIGPLRNSAGNIISPGTLGLFVVDQSNNGLLNAANTVLSVNSFLGGGTDDLILGTYTALDIGGSGEIGFDFSGAVINISGNTSTGDNLYFVWFPTLTNSAIGTTVGGGISYGAFTSAIKDEFADIAWVVPSDGASVSIGSLSAGLGGNPALTNLQATASLTTTGGVVIPEPSSFAALAGLAAVGMAASRRRRSA